MANNLTQPANAGGGSAALPTTTPSVPCVRIAGVNVPGSSSNTGGTTVPTQGQIWPRKT